MKRVLFIALAALTLGSGVQNAAAQKFELGARAGFGSQNLDFAGDDFAAKSRLGWHVAAVSRIRLLGSGVGLYFQPEVVYSRNANKVRSNLLNHTRASSDFAGASKIKMNSVDVPLLLSLRVSMVRVQAGPVFHLMNNFTSKGGNLQMQHPLRSAVGYSLGASVDLLGLTVDGRYYGDFGKFKGNYNDSGHMHSSVKSSLSSLSLGVGVMF